MNAAFGAAGIDEVIDGADRRRHGADFVHLADQKISKRLLWLGCRLQRGMMIALRRLMGHWLVCALMRWLSDSLGCGLRGRGQRLWRIARAAMLKLE